MVIRLKVNMFYRVFELFEQLSLFSEYLHLGDNYRGAKIPPSNKVVEGREEHHNRFVALKNIIVSTDLPYLPVKYTSSLPIV